MTSEVFTQLVKDSELSIESVVSRSITNLIHNYPTHIKGMSITRPDEAKEIETAIFKELLSQTFYRLIKMENTSFADIVIDMMMNKYMPISEQHGDLVGGIKDLMMHMDNAAAVISIAECDEPDPKMTYDIRYTGPDLENVETQTPLDVALARILEELIHDLT